MATTQEATLFVDDVISLVDVSKLKLAEGFTYTDMRQCMIEEAIEKNMGLTDRQYIAMVVARDLVRKADQINEIKQKLPLFFKNMQQEYRKSKMK